MDAAPIILRPGQSKMARAVLGWTQKDLASHAKVAVSTVADFERGHRAPMPQNLEAMRAAFLAAGLTLGDDGDISAKNRPGIRRLASGGGGPRSITIGDLRLWGERRDIQGKLLELVSRLVLAETGFAAQVRFPADEGIAFKGWDGVCTFGGPTAPGGYVPQGKSVWEVGTARRPTVKGEGDFEKRVRDTPPEERAGLHFRFLSPREFPRKDKWAEKKRLEGGWLSFEVLDEADLIHWLDRHPPVAAWLAGHIGKARRDTRLLTDWWEEWSLATRRPFSSDLLRASRDNEAAAVQRWLLTDDSEPVPPQAILAGSANEAVAFLYASIHQLPPEFARPHLVRAVVAETAEAARELALSLTPLIVVLLESPPGLAARLSQAGHHVFLALGSLPGRSDTVVTLPPPREPAIAVALEHMGVPIHEAELLARNCGGSLASLRLLMSDETGEMPDWAKPEPGRKLVAALLAGAWDERNEADGIVIEKLSGKSMSAYSKSVRCLLGAIDGPLRHTGSQWRLVSPVVALQRLGRYLSAADLVGFELVAAAAFRGELAVSNGMRAGMAATLAVMALHPQHAGGEADVAGSATRVLHYAFRASHGAAWNVVADELSTLAEADPKQFLAVLKADLDGGQSAVACLFSEWAGNAGSLLRALQMLAREERFLQDSCDCLLKLAALDDDGRHGYNRPLHALHDILSLWLPQTAANLKLRLRVLENLRSHGGGHVWRLLTKLIPGVPDSVDPAPNPRWRRLASPPEQAASQQAILEGYAAIADWIIDDAAKQSESSLERWETLADMLPRFDEERRNRILAELVKLGETANRPGVREQLRDLLRGLLHKHRQARDTWGLDESALAPLHAAYKQLEPTDSVERVAWLFESGMVWLPSPTDDCKDELASLNEVRQASVAEMFASRRCNGVLSLARAAKQPFYVGFAAATCAMDEPSRRRMLREALRSDEETIRQLADGMMAGLFPSKPDLADELLGEAREEGWSAERVVGIFQNLPRERRTWENVASFGAEVDDTYWKRVLPPLLPDIDPTEMVFVIRKLVAVGRAADALVIVDHCGGKLETDLIADVLQAAAGTKFEGDGSGNHRTMFEYHVTNILKHLDGRRDLPEERLVELELAHIELLGRGVRGSYGREPIALYRRLAADPEMFLKLIRDGNRPEQGSGIEPEDDDSSPDVVRRATVAHRILNSWGVLPGSGSGQFNAGALRLWIGEAKRLCSAAGRRQVADSYIGRLLCRAPIGEDGVWPCEAIRELAEDSFLGGDVEDAIVTGILNNRGVSWWSPDEGGDSHRDTARKYRRWAASVRDDWPRTGDLLDRIADMWTETGKRYDGLGDIVGWR